MIVPWRIVAGARSFFQIQMSNSKLGVIARLDRAIQYSRGGSA
jgi:hypothetical protein